MIKRGLNPEISLVDSFNLESVGTWWHSHFI